MCNRYSILPAITLDGIIECMIVEGSFNTELFTQFIEDLLGSMQPFPAAKSVIVMDNCAIHKAQQIRDLIESRQVLISYDSACTNVAFKGNEGRVPTSILAPISTLSSKSRSRC